ncbi:hypothetical protein B0W47_17845 (plasmid) [Komagataeibacter nataicola]|uniref:Uncharacterized protein n=1 Tax=Komagataeibacter nataicola TaxID=265960 RepID=A0A9N7CXB2_9PROT|nr:hypothetical protein [Komagataeibacter nataicola]AQU89395.1 hypothetical protein B0W47_17750 [Komagataeibacter nataicola]AQU89410.1 hypothetical protein B0W47_17845 [Komagataeibacter nataicola]PYD64959.1 hypothetical protein CDI09_16325 [Komagataeibacter nataicola]WNM10251.1 hypothetical protein RI056_18280 [Komagataeibacter nataicola]GBR20935.1 hypothetical protein AA0616_1912 [Komagataeibacter nataicola NRIC 0616]
MNLVFNMPPKTDADRLKLLAFQIEKHAELCNGAGVIITCLSEKMAQLGEVQADWIIPALRVVDDAVGKSASWLVERAESAVEGTK